MHSPQHLLRSTLCVAGVIGSLFFSTVSHAAVAQQQVFLPLVVSPPKVAPLLDSEEAAALDLANGYRAINGCPALEVSPELVAAADGHSDDMADHVFLKHEGSDHSEPWDRATKAGYSWSSIGENILYGMPTGEGAMIMWEESPGHKANILNCDYQDTGIARVQASNGDWYWTQVFGKPRN